MKESERYSYSGDGFTITMMNCDCRDYMRGLPDNWTDVCIADPPYGDDQKLMSGGNYMARYREFIGNIGEKPDKSWFDEVCRVSHNQIIWGGNYFDFLPPTRCFLIWHKTDGPKNFADCEYAWTSFDANARVFSSARNPHGISGTGRRIHNCQKPVQLYMWIMEKYVIAQGNKSVLDPTGGSFSSAIAAYELGLDYVGCEINAEYFKRGVERFKEHVENHPKLGI